jgi:uncharacterized protein YuzE
MTKMNPEYKFDYDYENDSLFVYDSMSKSKSSVEIDDLIIDYNSKKEVSAVELLNASQFFKDILSKDMEISKDKLKDITSCNLEIIPKNNFFIIKFVFTLKSKEILTAPILVPTINESSPSLMV